MGRNFLSLGDFNAILRSEDKKGGVGRVLQSQSNLINFVERNMLIEVQMGNGSFTLNRRKGYCSIAEKLDRFFFKGNLGHFPFTLDCKIVSSVDSDHFPIQLEIIGEKGPIRCLFKI